MIYHKQSYILAQLFRCIGTSGKSLGLPRVALPQVEYQICLENSSISCRKPPRIRAHPGKRNSVFCRLQSTSLKPESVKPTTDLTTDFHVEAEPKSRWTSGNLRVNLVAERFDIDIASLYINRKENPYGKTPRSQSKGSQRIKDFSPPDTFNFSKMVY